MITMPKLCQSSCILCDLRYATAILQLRRMALGHCVTSEYYSYYY